MRTVATVMSIQPGLPGRLLFLHSGEESSEVGDILAVWQHEWILGWPGYPQFGIIIRAA